MADYKTKQFFGTAQTVIDSSTDIAAGAFGGAGTAFDNTSDASVPYAPYAVAMLEAPDWAGAPVAGTTVELWGLLQNTDGTEDDTQAPASAASGGARLFGAWALSADDALQRRTIVISLEGVQSGFVPYLKNTSAQNLNADGGTNLVVKITPFAYGITV